jgi:cytochrome c
MSHNHRLGTLLSVHARPGWAAVPAALFTFAVLTDGVAHDREHAAPPARPSTPASHSSDCDEPSAPAPLEPSAPAPLKPSAPAPLPAQKFQKVTLNGAPGEPIGLAVLPDGRVLHTTRGGRIWLHNPETGFNTVAAQVPVYNHDEEGLQGIALDPQFARNGWVYLYYSPPLSTPLDDPATPTVIEGDAPETVTAADVKRFKGHMQLSRFRFEGSAVNLATEQRILQIPVDRGICCHVGGDIDFDREGNLYLSTGDDTNPFQSDSYAPLDSRPGRHPAFDARRSSGNTNDLRGKLLRIRVNRNGGYTIPGGNLFPPGTKGTRPEIYAMGLRNPFRFSIGRDVDRKKDVVYLADYSPDSPTASPERGPAGQGRWMVVREPGNYGWPFCATAELPYRRFDFATNTSGDYYDCARPINDSPHNTGRRQLPRVVQPEVWYPAGASPEFPELGTGGVAPMAGPAYVFDARVRSDRQWPKAFAGIPLFYEWSRDAIFGFTVQQSRRQRPGTPSEVSIQRLFSDLTFQNPIDMTFGPDGALYVLEYGDGYFLENPEAQLSRVDAVRANSTPSAAVTADVLWGQPPLTVKLSAEGSTDADGDAIQYFWDFDSDGVVDANGPTASVTYTTVGSKAAAVRVVDSTGRSSSAAARITVGNVPPQVRFAEPAVGQPFQFGDTVHYRVEVLDDTPIDCSRVEVQHLLVHDQHAHSLSTVRGCEGQVTTALDTGHAGAENVFGALVANYNDLPTVPGVPSLNGGSVILLTAPAISAFNPQ